MKNRQTGCVKLLPRVYREKTERIITIVLAEFAFTERQLWRGGRSTLHCWARWICWHFMMKAGMSSVMVAKVSGRDHTTVLYGVDMLQQEMKRRADLADMFHSVKSQLGKSATVVA